MKVCLHCGAANQNNAERCSVCDKSLKGKSYLLEDTPDPNSTIPQEQPSAGTATGSRMSFDRLIAIDTEMNRQPAPEYNTTLTLAELVEQLQSFLRIRGCQIERAVLCSLLAGMATSKLLFVRDQTGNAEVAQGLLQSISAFFGSTLAVGNVREAWKQPHDMLTVVDPAGDRMMESPILCELYRALYRKNTMHAVALRNVATEDMLVYFIELWQALKSPWKAPYFYWDHDGQRTPQRFTYDDQGADYAGTWSRREQRKMKIPQNVWYWILPQGGAPAAYKIPKSMHSYVTVVDLKGTLKGDLGASAVQPVSGAHFASLARNAKKEYFPKEEYWKRVDLFAEYLNRTVGYTVNNLQWRRLETYLSVYIACGGDVMDAFDHAIAANILPELACYNSEKLLGKGSDTKLSEQMIQIFGEDHISACIQMLKEMKLY